MRAERDAPPMIQSPAVRFERAGEAVQRTSRLSEASDSGWMVDEETVQRAAFHISDAYDSGTDYVHPRRGAAARRAYVQWLTLRPVLRVLTMALLGLSFFEQPGWSRAVSGRALSPVSPLFGLPILSPAASAATEGALLLALLLDWALQLFFQGVVRYLGCPRQLGYATALLVLIADYIASLAAPTAPFRLATYLRIVLVALTSEEVRTQLLLIQRTVPDVAGVLLVLAAFLGFFAWSALLLFSGSAEGVLFPEAATTAWQLLILLTTANYPDVMMPAYSASRPAVLFFGTFLVLGNWFLLNLVLAVVYKAHGDSLAALSARRKERQARSLHKAYWLLSTSSADGRRVVHGVTSETMFRVFEELNLYKDIAFVSTEKAKLLFAALDRSGENLISESEFQATVWVLDVQFKKITVARAAGDGAGRLIEKQ